MREQLVEGQRRQQPPYEQGNATFDVNAEPIPEQVVAVDGEYDEGFANTFAKCRGVVANFSINSGSPSFIFREIERRIGLGKHVLGETEEILKIFPDHVPADGEQGVDLRSDAAILPDRPDGGVVQSQQSRNVFFDPFIASVPPEGDSFPVGIGLVVPCADQSHRDQSSRDPIILGPFGCPDRGDTRKPPPQNRRRATRFPRQPIGFVTLDAHIDKGLFESAVVEQVERDVELGIDNVAGANGDAMPLAVYGGQLAFGRVGVDDREERRRRRCQLPQRFRRLEHRREVPPSRGDAVLLEQAREERQRLVPGIGGDGEQTIGRLSEPLLKGVPMRGERRAEYRGCHHRLARFSPALPASVECFETIGR